MRARGYAGRLLAGEMTAKITDRRAASDQIHFWQHLVAEDGTCLQAGFRDGVQAGGQDNLTVRRW